MKLSDIDLGKHALITKIECNDELKKRFFSFGIVKGAEVIVKNTSINKNTIEIIIENTNIALRYDEAQSIEVELIDEM